MLFDSSRTLPGPVVREELLRRLGGQARHGLAVPLREAPHEVLGEQQHVRSARAQRRHFQVDHVDAEVEVLPERALLHHRFEIPVGRRQDARVEGHLLRRTHRQDHPLLQRAQQLRLHVERQLAHLVEEQRAAARAHEHAFPPGPSRR
jgi:hypothetical protein